MTDLLETELSKHIWYTTTVRGGSSPVLICKCTAQMANTIAHTAHVAKVARNAMAQMAAS